MTARPHFIIKDRFQKRRATSYREVLPREILQDVCRRVTGRNSYTVEFDDSDYNKGRLATLVYNGFTNFISFSEAEVTSRNSSFQSFPSALTRYYQESNPQKRIYFYFLPSTGNIETPYFIFMYRLMKTAGTVFLNEAERLTISIIPFNSVEDIVASKNVTRSRNPSNASSYLTKDEEGTLQIYGKTYGANKYETILLCFAISALSTGKVELYEIQEGSLRELPSPAREVIQSLGVKIVPSDISLERDEYNRNDSLRSPTFIYNLLAKYGAKKCALCDCEIPQLIAGAHIWPVATIKRATHINQAEKLRYAVDGENGIWLCNNHHKLFDVNFILIDRTGRTRNVSNLRQNDQYYLRDLTVNRQLPVGFLTPKFLRYLQKRNSSLDTNLFTLIQ